MSRRVEALKNPLRAKDQEASVVNPTSAIQKKKITARPKREQNTTKNMRHALKRKFEHIVKYMI